METSKDIFAPYIGEDRYSAITEKMDSEWEKVASVAPGGKGWKHNVARGLYHLATKMFLPAGGMIGGGYIASKMMETQKNRQLDIIKDQIASNRAELMTRPTYAQNQQKFEKMFDDVQEIAPNVAANSLVIDKILSAHINDDINMDTMNTLRNLNQSFAPPEPTNRTLMFEELGLTRGTEVGEGIRTAIEGIGAPPPIGHPQRPMYMAMNKQSSVNVKTGEDEALGRMAYNHLEFMSIAYNTQGFEKIAARGKGAVLKKAKDSGFLKALMTGFKALAPGMAVTGAGYGAYRMGRKKMLEGQSKDILNSYQAVDDSVELSDMDPSLRHDAFNALATFAPSIAAKPIAAKTFVSMVKTRGGVDPDLLRQITQIEEGHQKIRNLDSFGGSGFMKSFQPAFNIGKDVSSSYNDTVQADRYNNAR